MEKISAFMQNVYQQSLMYYRDSQRGEVMQNYQAHLAVQLVKDSSDSILNTSSKQLTAIKNNLISVISTLPESNTRPECKINCKLDPHPRSARRPP
jgi:hypothetical protein